MTTKDFFKQLGKRLKQLRLQANMSQEELAERVNVATKTVSYWENAHNPTSLNKIPLIAKALNVPIYKLFIFLESDEIKADSEYIELLQIKTGKELDILINALNEFKKIK